MKRIPIVSTLIVVMAVVTMIALGIWQLRRAEEKRILFAGYEQARNLPPIAWPVVPDPRHLPLFRRTSAHCLEIIAWRSASGRNRGGDAGWSHIASCRGGGGEGPGFQAVMGWSTTPNNPDWRGGPVHGVVAPDSRHLIRLVASNPAPGLVPSAPPSPDDIPNNHLAYAIQWFLFATIAAVIYGLALRRRSPAEH